MDNIGKFLKNGLIFVFLYGVAIVMMNLCTGRSSSSSDKYAIPPALLIADSMNNQANFSIILADMEYEDKTFGKDIFRHKYQIITPDSSGVDMTETGWKDVNERYFADNINNLGMTIVSKVDGKLNQEIMPAGYSQYVGNEKYGRWVERDGGSFWEFYGRYAMMRSLFNLGTPITRTSYDDYSKNYRGQSKPYYGTPSMSSTRGTGSSWAKQSSSFKNSVQSKVSRSATPSSRSMRSTGSSSSSSSKTVRPSSSSTRRSTPIRTTRSRSMRRRR